MQLSLYGITAASVSIPAAAAGGGGLLVVIGSTMRRFIPVLRKSATAPQLQASSLSTHFVKIRRMILSKMTKNSAASASKGNKLKHILSTTTRRNLSVTARSRIRSSIINRSSNRMNPNHHQRHPTSNVGGGGGRKPIARSGNKKPTASSLSRQQPQSPQPKQRVSGDKGKNNNKMKTNNSNGNRKNNNDVKTDYTVKTKGDDDENDEDDNENDDVNNA